MLNWFLSTKVGRWASIALAVLASALSVYFLGRREGSQRAIDRARQADMKNARDIEDRADEAIRKFDGDNRPVDERLRERGKLRRD